MNTGEDQKFKREVQRHSNRTKAGFSATLGILLCTVGSWPGVSQTTSTKSEETYVQVTGLGGGGGGDGADGGGGGENTRNKH